MSYKYELFYDGTFLHEDGGFDDQDEARDDADMEIDSRLDAWVFDGVIKADEREEEKKKFHVEIEEE